QAPPVRARSVPAPSTVDPTRGLRARRLQLPVLRRRRREPRSRPAEGAPRPPRLGERRRRLPPLQRQEDGSHAGRGRLHPGARAVRPIRRVPPDPRRARARLGFLPRLIAAPLRSSLRPPFDPVADPPLRTSVR